MTEPLPCKHVAHDPLHEGREASFHQSCRAEVPIAEERPIAPQAAQEQAEVLERFLTGLLMDLAGRQVDNPQENLTLSDAKEAGGPIPPAPRHTPATHQHVPRSPRRGAWRQQRSHRH